MADISAVKTWGNETLTPTDLNAEFSNVYTNHVSKSTEQTVSGVKTHSAAIILQDNVNLTFGTGSDATIDYDGTNLVIDPDVVGSGVLSLQGGLTVGVDNTGYDVQVFGDTSGKFVKWDTGTDSLELPDNTNLTFGTGQDADIYYDGTNLVIDPAVVGSGIVHVSGGAMKVEIDDNAAASVKDAFTVEWDPADDGNMTDTSSGLAIAFTLPDDADTQTIMGRLQLVVNDDAAGSEDTEWQLVRMVAGSLTAQSFGASLANDANNRVTTADGSGGLNGEANLTFDGTTLNVVGNAGVGIARTEGTLHVHTASAGTVTAETVADDLVVENSAAGGVTVLTPDGYSGRYQFGTPSDAGHSYIESFYNSGAEWMNFHVGGTNRMRIHDGGILSINETANANMTTGLTINQGANDDEAFALKSSDVAHGITGNAETDTYFLAKKLNPANGGVSLQAYSESSVSSAFWAFASAGQPSTTPSTSAIAHFDFYGAEHSSGTIGNYTANGLVFAVSGRVGGAQRRLFFVDEDGDVHVDGSGTLGTFDHEPDALLMRAGRHGLLEGGAPLWMNCDPKELRRMQDVLQEHEIIHWNRKEDGGDGVPFINIPRSVMLAWDGLYQAHSERQELREALDAERSQRMALEARLNLIEQKGRN